VAVQFFDSSTGSPTSWLWDFGDVNDPTTSSAQNPFHTFSVAMDYTVTLTASTEGGSTQDSHLCTVSP